MDIISGLPNPIIAHILSFLPTKEAASTSVLSKRWRLLFALVSDLDFDDSVYVHSMEEEYDENSNEFPASFMAFVDRVLVLQGNATVDRFSLRCRDGVDPDRVTSWILNVLGRGVSEIVLNALPHEERLLPSEIFVSKTLVKLKLGEGHRRRFICDCEVDDVSLPKLKTLYLNVVVFLNENDGLELTQLLSGCPVLEELVLIFIRWEYGKHLSSSISFTTLKRLTFSCEAVINSPTSVSFDTPNLVYLEYIDTIPNKYPKINFGSLVQAHIGLQLTSEQSTANENDDEMVGNATQFFMGICNVQTLVLTAGTIELLAFCCKETPVFNNLIHLTIESDTEVEWEALPGLLKNCPNLETLVFMDLNHRSTDGCGNMCRCEPPKNPSCLSSSPVKVLKVYMSGQMDDERMETGQIKLFLEKMPRLEQLIVYFDTSCDHDVFQLSKKLQKIQKIASPMCKIQVVSENLSLSSTLPSSLSKKWSAPREENYTWFLSPLS